jgi:hypothetical protein
MTGINLIVPLANGDPEKDLPGVVVRSSAMRGKSTRGMAARTASPR